MNWRAIKALVIKDLRVIVQNKGVVLPMLIVPVIFMVVLPGAISVMFSYEAVVADFSGELNLFMDALPAHIQDAIAPYETESQRLLYLALVYQFAPLFLIVPLMMSSVIAADSFAGEKERGTIEALVYTPLTDIELYASKLLTAWIPALLVTLGGGLLYSVVSNVAAYPIMGEVFLPNALWLILVLWVAPAAAGLGLASMVLVSSRANSFQEAYQLGGVIVLPVVALMLGQLAGVIYLSTGLLVMVGAALWVIDALLLWYGASTFQRSEIIARLA